MKRKIYLEFVITLFLGFFIGFFTNSIITDKRIKEYSLHKGESDFWRRALSEVGVTQEQRQAIRPIIKEYSYQAHLLLIESWKNMLPIWDEMEEEILNELNTEQQKHLRAIQEERKKRFQQHFDQPPHRRMYNDSNEQKHRQYNRKHKNRPTLNQQSE